MEEKDRRAVGAGWATGRGSAAPIQRIIAGSAEEEASRALWEANQGRGSASPRETLAGN